MSLIRAAPTAAATRLVETVDDRYLEARGAGAVVGSRSACGAERRGIDVEGRLAIDHGALRIGCPVRPGWDRHALVYGPFAPRAGLAASVLLLDGHNSSQTAEVEGGALARAFTRAQRLGWRLRGEARALLARRFASVPAVARRLARPGALPNHYWWPPITENLAVGWFPRERMTRPHREGHAFVMRSGGAVGGRLGVLVRGRAVPVLESVQNVPLHVVVLLRPQGAAYYVASLPGVPGVAALPELLPVGIDPTEGGQEAFAGLHQSVLGEVGFRVDTRVYGARVAPVPAWSAWCGSAHAADRLGGDGEPLGGAAERGGWTVVRGDVRRAPDGARASRDGGLALLDAPAPSGLVHARLAGAGAGLVWRAGSGDSYWAACLDRRGARLVLVEGGREREVARTPGARALRGGVASLQVLDDGRGFSVALDGAPLFGGRVEDARLSDGTGVGLRVAGDAANARIRELEAHPRRVALPEVLDLGAPWQPAPGPVAVADRFTGPARPLELRRRPAGPAWGRTLGAGRLDVTGGGAVRVRARRARPNPGRTLYTVPWRDPAFADLQVEVVPPGGPPGEGELTRAGLVFWQDPGHYVVLNAWNDDRFPGASVSTFFVLGGEEDLYRAVWTNVGRRIERGRPCALRVAFDGDRYLARLDGEPVLYRALTDVYPHAGRLAIRRVGLAANWEFGDDTGSRFRAFVARRGR